MLGEDRHPYSSNCVLPITLSARHRFRPFETYREKTGRSNYVKSSNCSPLRTSLLILALTATTSLHSQNTDPSASLVASLGSLTANLPDEPLPQNSAQPPASSSAPQPPASTEDEEKKKKEAEHEAAEEQLKIQQKQRMVGIVPNFNAVLNGNAVPLSGGQKMRAAFRSAIDPYQFGLAAFTAGIGQATDSHSSIDANGVRHGYEQGWTGYAKRFGAGYVDQFDGTMIGNGILPAVLHQDPRYYRLGEGKVSKRFWYAVIAAVRCKGDNGKWQPNYSNVLGNLAAGGISNLYYPAADRGFELTVRQALVVTAEGAFGTLVIEFYPDVMKHVFHKNQPAPDSPTPQAQVVQNPQPTPK
jgi:hypothetical protein